MQSSGTGYNTAPASAMPPNYSYAPQYVPAPQYMQHQPMYSYQPAPVPVMYQAAPPRSGSYVAPVPGYPQMQPSYMMPHPGYYATQPVPTMAAAAASGAPQQPQSMPQPVYVKPAGFQGSYQPPVAQVAADPNATAAQQSFPPSISRTVIVSSTPRVTASAFGTRTVSQTQRYYHDGAKDSLLRRPDMSVDQFLKVYTDVKNQFLSEFHSIFGNEARIADEVAAYYDRCLDYTAPGGKMTRGLTVVKAAKACAVDAANGTGRPFQYDDQTEFLAAVLGWTVEILQACFLVADDVMDESHVRRGSPCWYKLPEITQANAINDSMMLRAMIFRVLRHYFSGHVSYCRLIETINENDFLTIAGQFLDTNSQRFNAPIDMRRMTLDRYKAIVKHKTAYYSFYLPCALGMTFAGVQEASLFEKVRRVCMMLGEYFQVQDDVLDCFGDPEVIGKVGTDIEEAKCSWLICQALLKATPSQYAVLEQNYGSKQPEQVALVKAIYREMRLQEEFDKYEDQMKSDINTAIAAIEAEGLRDVLNFLLSKIYKRKK